MGSKLSTRKSRRAKGDTVDAWPETRLMDCCWMASDEVGVACVDGRVVLANVATGKVREVGRHAGAVTCVVSCGGLLYTSSRDKSLAQWSRDGLQQQFQGHELSATAVAADGTLVASGSRDATVRIWDIERAMQVTVARVPRNMVTSLAWIPGTSTFAQGSEDLRLRVWDCRTGSVVQTMVGYTYFPLCVDASDSLLVTGSKGFSGEGAEVRVWDTRRHNAPTHDFKGHQQDATACALFTHGRVLSASKDQTLRIWDLEESTSGSSTIVDVEDAGIYTGLAVSSGSVAATTFQGTLVCLDSKLRQRTTRFS